MEEDCLFVFFMLRSPKAFHLLLCAFGPVGKQENEQVFTVFIMCQPMVDKLLNVEQNCH